MFPKSISRLTAGGLWILITVIMICVFNVVSDFATSYQISLTSEESDRITKTLGKPFVNDNQGHTTNIVVAGKPFYVFNRYSRSDVCYYEGSIQILSSKTFVAFTMRTNASWLPAGTMTYNDFLEVPNDFPPGAYHVVKKMTNHCGSKTFFSTVYDIPVTVVAGKV